MSRLVFFLHFTLKDSLIIDLSEILQILDYL